MKVKRIVCNIDTQDITAAKCFYQAYSASIY
ncbi:hypothetical protein FHS14_005735 [Paenibacillus baekrokdamisoli]|nr:hypothetical protein [Paenibacillus baekrokdamisoli]